MGCSLSKETLDGKTGGIYPQFEQKPEKEKSFKDLEKGNSTHEKSCDPKYRTKVDTRVTAKYDIKALIGKGTFSDVLRVESKTSRQPYAIKVLRSQNVQMRELLSAELETLKKTEHRYIIKLEEVIISKDMTYLVMELATGGELYDRIKSKGYLDEKQTCQITQMLVEGIEYLHQNNITHRDLKPENLLFYHPGVNSKILITDFGFAKYTSDPSIDCPLNTWCGTPEYIAPELLQKKPYNSKVDVWALGVIVYVMLSGHLPFSADTTPKLFQQILAANYSYSREVWSKVSRAAKDFIDKLLKVDPNLRCTATVASSDCWLASVTPLHKPKSKPNKTKKTRHRTSFRVGHENQPPFKKFSRQKSFTDDASMKSDSTFRSRLKESKSGLVLPFSGGYEGKILTKEKILDDGASTMTPSNIDSMLATEDTNSIPSNLGLLHEYMGKFQYANDPAIKERIRSMYMETLLTGKNNVTVPVQGQLKAKHRISMHEQFTDINEDSEDEADLIMDSRRMDLTKLDHVYSEQTGSVVSFNSLKSHHIPIDTSNLSSGYIQKVGVWLSGHTDEESHTDEQNFTSLRRTTSNHSSIAPSDQSNQGSTFSRFLFPKTISESNSHTISVVPVETDSSYLGSL